MKLKGTLVGLLVLTIIVFGMAGLQSQVIQAKVLVVAEEREVTFTRDGLTLSGTLSIPEHQRDKRLPVIVLVHGSGAHDRDVTFPVNGAVTLKPFYDLAMGLKEQGFAVLRYDKRSYILVQKEGGPTAEELQNLQVDDFIKDAQAAIEFVQGVAEVDPEQVILLGHSQGASFIPQIAEGQELAGAVAIAPNMLPIMETLLYQLDYQLGMLKKLNTSGIYDQQVAQIEEQKVLFTDLFAKLQDGSADPTQVFMGASGSFWLRWQELTTDTPQQLVAQEFPILFMNGTQDLKCPVHLVQQREMLLKQKDDLQLVYLENVGHEMYNPQTLEFAHQIFEEINLWWQDVK